MAANRGVRHRVDNRLRVCGCYATLSRRPPALNAPGRTTRNALGRMTTNDPERTTPNGTAPGLARDAMPAARNAKPALAWRYPRRAPVAKRITNPPAPGNAPAASAHSETGSRSSPKTCGKDAPAPIGNAASGAGGAIPDTADARPTAITSSVATPVASPVTGRPETPASGRPEIPASGRPSGCRDRARDGSGTFPGAPYCRGDGPRGIIGNHAAMGNSGPERDLPVRALPCGQRQA
jgi:hypothetical protein